MAGTTASPERTLVTVAEGARRYNCSERTIRRWISAGLLPGYRVGPRMIRVDLDELGHLARPITAPSRPEVTR